MNRIEANRINQTSLKTVPVAPQADNPSYSAPIHLDAMSLPFPMAILRANDGHVMYANQMMAALMKCDVEELYDKPIQGLFDSGDQRSDVFKQLKRRAVIPPSTVTVLNSANKKLRYQLHFHLHAMKTICAYW